MIPSEITVLIDSRERTPLLFPSWIEVYKDRTVSPQNIQIKTKTTRMATGDYAIKGYEEVCLIETKRSLRELHNNVCSNEWPRVCKALNRLSEACDHPYLVWEISPSELFQKTRYVDNPYLVFDRWMQAIARLNLRLMIVGGQHTPGPRRKLGEQLVRLMIAHIVCGGFFDGV